MEDTALPPGANVLIDNGSGVDSDPNGDAITVQLVSAPIHASVFSLLADGSFAYTPALNYNGPDLFQYRPFDGWLYGNPVTVTLTITPQNDWPVAANDSARTPERRQCGHRRPGQRHRRRGRSVARGGIHHVSDHTGL